MAHQLATHKAADGTTQHSFAARGGAKTAWHGLGQEILPGDSIKVIAKKAGLAWTAAPAPIFYKVDGKVHDVPDQVMNYREDTGEPLGIVSTNFKNVQPSQVLEFFEEFLKSNKMRMETAGAIRGGRTIWALAELGPEYGWMLPGKDKIRAYVRLQTGFDGKRATDLVGTSIRQICANTERMVNDEADRGGSAYRVAHTSIFDSKALQAAFGLLGEQHKMTAAFWNALCERKVNAKERQAYFCTILGIEGDPAAVDAKGEPVHSSRIRNMLKELNEAFETGPGAALTSAKDTAYGLLQAVTYWVDHKSTVRDVHKDGQQAARLNSVWYGLGDRTKRDAQYVAAELADCLELIGYEKEAVAA